MARTRMKNIMGILYTLPFTVMFAKKILLTPSLANASNNRSGRLAGSSGEKVYCGLTTARSNTELPYPARHRTVE